MQNYIPNFRPTSITVMSHGSHSPNDETTCFSCSRPDQNEKLSSVTRQMGQSSISKLGLLCMQHSKRYNKCYFFSGGRGQMQKFVLHFGRYISLGSQTFLEVARLKFCGIYFLSTDFLAVSKLYLFSHPSKSAKYYKQNGSS